MQAAMTEGGRRPNRIGVDRSEGFGERLLGVLLDRAHEMPPQLIAPLVAEEVARVGGRDVSILLQDYEQLLLVPLPGRGLTVGEPEPIDGSPAGAAFLSADHRRGAAGRRRADVPAVAGRQRPGGGDGRHPGHRR